MMRLHTRRVASRRRVLGVFGGCLRQQGQDDDTLLLHGLDRSLLYSISVEPLASGKQRIEILEVGGARGGRKKNTKNPFEGERWIACDSFSD